MTTKPSAESEVELPELDVTPEDIERGEKYKLPDYLQPDDLQDVMKWWIKLFSWMGGAIESRERQLRQERRDKRAAEQERDAAKDELEARKESWTFADEEQIVTLREELAAANQRADEATRLLKQLYESSVGDKRGVWDFLNPRPTGKAGE